MVTIRIAKPSDAQGILQIYSPHVQHGVCTFETNVVTADEMEGRIARCLQKFPWIVCEIDGTTAGYVYASTHREREAYQWTCECSVYVHERFKSKGIGVSLYSALLQILKTQGLVNVYAGITLPNPASIRLHERCGFVLFAEYDNIGYKLGAWHKVGWWKHQLNDYQLMPSPPLSFSQLDVSLLTKIFEDAAAVITQKFSS